MRRLLLWLTVIALLLGGLWLGAEGLLVRELRRIAGQVPELQIGTLHELRRPGRIGVAAVGVTLDTPSVGLALPQAQAWVSPLQPTVIRLALPPTATLDAGAGPVTLGLTDARAGLGLRVQAEAEFNRLEARSGPLTLDGRPLAQGFDVTARLADDGGYDMTLSLRDLAPEALADPLPLPGLLNLHATGRVWLDRPPSPRTLSPETAPLPTGLRLDGSEISLGRLRARVLGQLHADAQGRAQGVLAIYSPDARPMLDAAAAAGLIPQRVVVLAGAMLTNIAALPLPTGADFPAAAAGELRLPLVMADGTISLGPVTLGPAPMFPRR